MSSLSHRGIGSGRRRLAPWLFGFLLAILPLAAVTTCLRFLEAAPSGGGAPGPAVWSFSPRLPSETYRDRRPGPQAEPMVEQVRWLLHPTTGVPALAWAGQTLELLVGVALTLPARGVTATLTARIDGELLTYPLRVVRVEPLAAGWRSRVTCVVPASVPRESFDLELGLPDGRRERHARAVRVLHSDEGSLRAAIIADHQLWDPSSRLLKGARFPGLHPHRGSGSAAGEMARQGLEELVLLDPDLVLHLGDLIFGLEPQKELQEAKELLASSGPAAFFVPGNHDGYARYGIDLQAALPRLAVGMVECRRHLQDQDSFTWRSLWGFLGCVYGDIRPVLFRRLLSDGLEVWRRSMGPTEYAFDLGPFRFVGMNTYDGTPERRHAFSIQADIRGLRLGAPMVDNYGGYLSVPQLRWIEAEAKDASSRGKRLVLYGHHDPRGNPGGAPYHANQPFPTDPVGAGHFEAWNYDDQWDSNPADDRGPESATEHSGHALLRILGSHGGLYLSGHVHRDSTSRVSPGEALRDGILARHPVSFLQITTASAAPGEGGYWGTRLIRLLPDGQVESPHFAPDLGLQSLPFGGLWLGPVRGAREVAAVHTALPRPVRVRLRALLPHRTEGYHFTISPSPALVELVDVAQVSEGRALYYLAASIPAAGAALVRSGDEVRRFVVSASPLAKNRPPEPGLAVNGRRAPHGSRIQVKPGALVLLSADDGTDPDGHGLLTPMLEAEDGRGGRKGSLTLEAPEDGDLEVRLSLRDSHGALGLARVVLTTTALTSPTPPGAGEPTEDCDSAGRAVLWGALAVLLLGAALVFLGRRRRV